ncbi:MAG: hypothetical protein ABI140_18805 [Jatrophihabitantaceae bacterium]
MVRIVAELVVLLLIVAGLLYLARQWDRHQSVGSVLAPQALQAPADASWQAAHYGTAQDETEIVVVLRSPASRQVWDRRTCGLIANQDPDYDRKLYNAMADARSRAFLLNGLREEG